MLICQLLLSVFSRRSSTSVVVIGLALLPVLRLWFKLSFVLVFVPQGIDSPWSPGKPIVLQ